MKPITLAAALHYTGYWLGTRFGPMAIRMTDYLPRDGGRPSLALRTDGMQDLRVVDAGDMEMPPGDILGAPGALELLVVGIVVEVSPPYGHADITAALANRVVLEALSAVAHKRRNDRDGTGWDPGTPLLEGRGR